MERETVQDYLQKSGMNEAQSEALSRVLAQMATKADLQSVKAEMATKTDLQSLRVDMQSLKAELTWRFFAAMVLLATVMTVLDVFVD